MVKSWALVCALALVASCKKAADDDSGRKGGPVAVVVGEVVQKDLPLEVRALGTVEPVSTVEVVPQVSGLIMEVHFKEGDFVKAGAPLFTIDTRPYSSTLAAAQAQLARNKALFEQAQAEAQRYENLHREGLASAQDLARARAQASSLSATLEENKAQIRSASLNVQFSQIRSPIEGRTGSLLVHAGNVVRANESGALVVIRTLSPAYVRFAVPQEHLPKIRQRFAQGDLQVRATPRGAGAKTVLGQVTFLENTVDPATGTLSLKALFKNEDQELWPGAFVDVVLELDVDRAAVVAPEAAIQTGQEGTFAYVVEQDEAVLREVQVKRTTATEAIVEKGLSPGERVVVDGHIRLKDGSKVSIKPSGDSALAEGAAQEKRK